MKKFNDWHWIVKISGPIFYSLLAVSVIAYFVFFREDSRELISLNHGCISLGIVIFGYILMLTARFQLKDKFFILARDAKYITTGLYKHFRHPIYMSSTLSGFGIMIFFLTFKIGELFSSVGVYEEVLLKIVAIILFATYAINQYNRAEKEEKVLKRKDPAGYRIYMKKTIC